MAGGGGSPAQGGGFGGNMAGFGFGLLPGLLMSKMFSGQGQPAHGGGSPMGGMFGGPQMQMQPHGQVQPQSNPNAQYHASPAAGAQIQSLLSGTAGSPFAGAGMGGATALTPGMQLAQSMIPQTKEGGGQSGDMGLFGLGIAPGLLGNAFGVNNRSPIGDIAGALALGRPITDAQWASAGYGPGGSPLGG